MLLWRKGPDTEGVFRTACNSKNLSAVRDQLNSGVTVDLEALPVTLLVGLLKVCMKSLLQHTTIHTAIYTYICIVTVIPSISQYILGQSIKSPGSFSNVTVCNGSMCVVSWTVILEAQYFMTDSFQTW